MPTYEKTVTETVEVANDKLQLIIRFDEKSGVGRELLATLRFDVTRGGAQETTSASVWLSDVADLSADLQSDLVKIRNAALASVGLTQV